MELSSWDDLRVLLAVHRSGSLQGAGKSLGLATSTTGRRLAALELAMGCKLVHRSQRGSALAAQALRLVKLAEELEHGLLAQKRDEKVLAGTLRISVPDGMVHAIGQPLIVLCREHPGIEIELVGESRMANLAVREADIGLRLTRSRSNVLIEKHVATLRFSLFASAEYARRYLPARRLLKTSASAQAFIGLDTRLKGLPREQWLTELGATRFVFRSSSMEAIIDAVREGLGLAALPEQDVRHADLVQIGTETLAPVQPLYLVYHRDLRNAPHVRAALTSIENCMRALR